MLKDLDSIIKRLAKLEKQIKTTNNSLEKKSYEQEYKLLEEVQKAIDAMNASEVKTLISNAAIPTLPLLSAKKCLIIANLSEHEISDNNYEANHHYQKLIQTFERDHVVPVCARLELELSQLSSDEATAMMSMIGTSKCGIEQIIKTTYKELGLITFFTCGPKEIHAWTIKSGTNIQDAAGEIHSDLQKGFICAEVFNYEDLINLGSENAVKETGKLRREGKGYIVQNGDIVHIRFNV